MNKVIKNLSFNWAFCQQSQASLSITILNLGILFWRCLHEGRHIIQHNDTQHNDIWHNDTQLKGFFMTLSITLFPITLSVAIYVLLC